MLLKIFLLVVTYNQVLGQRDAKWIWSNNSRSSDEKIYTGLIGNNDRKYNGELVNKPLFQASQDFSGANSRPSKSFERYEIDENVEDIERPPNSVYKPTVYQPTNNGYRPTNQPNNGYRPTNQPNNGYRPTNQPNNGYRPTNQPNNGYRPPNNYRPPLPPQSNFGPSSFDRPGHDINRPYPGSQGPYRPGGPGNGGYRPQLGPNGQPVLTGPIPSWQSYDPNRYKDYDKCKCVHSFNCNSPGIKFGTCDIDKQYCCYTSSPHVGPSDVRDPHLHDRPRPVLSGPSSTHGGDRPYDRPPLKNRPNIGSKPFGPFSELDRYLDRDQDLDDLYKRGLETAVYEQYKQEPYRPYNDRRYQNNQHRPTSYRDYYTNDYYDRDNDRYRADFNRHDGKYGLYVEPYYNYGGRSASGSILAKNTTEVK